MNLLKAIADSKKNLVKPVEADETVANAANAQVAKEVPNVTDGAHKAGGVVTVQGSATLHTPPASPKNLLAGVLGGLKKPPNASGVKLNPLAEALKQIEKIPVSEIIPPKSDEAIHAESPDDAGEVDETDEDDDAEGDPEAEIATGAIGAEEFNHPSQPDKFTQEEIKEFQQAFAILKGNFDYPEQIGQSIAHCMNMLKSKPHLKDLLKDDDARTMVQALRIGYGTAIQIKKTAVAKKTKKSAEIDDFTQQLAASGLSGLGEIKL